MNRILAATAVAAASLSGCDSTVGLDPTRPTFTRLLVPGACKVSDDLQMIDISVMMLDGTTALLPDDRLQREFEPISQLLSHEDFRFARTADSTLDTAEVAVALGEDSGMQQGVDLRTLSLEFDYSGGADRQQDRRLVVLLMDHSGSLVGEDPFTQMITPGNATDREDQRIAFFQQLVNNLPREYLVSLVSFKGSFVNITAEYSTPQPNRENIAEGIGELQFDESGRTPLADALDQTLTRIIDSQGNRDLNPVVILFTDGVEDGDASATNLEAVTERYANHAGGPVPVIVMQLQPPIPTGGSPGFARGRDLGLVNLACRTGGEHLFIEAPAEFTESQNLQAIVRNRIVGTWRLRTETTMNRAAFPPDNYFLSTELTVTLGGRSRSQALSRGSSGRDFDDTRLWFNKQ
ncbi:MAG: VWA domain-containing protein [Myxococcales bacterium]|nr:VWA domain-containing protein [Myxococcales bacterium]MCB9536369.1 VWA domain-containing protein [Myxococcales bacterium]